MRQSASYSRWEVGLDFAASIAINIGTQAFALRTFTMARGLSFSVVFLTLALLRRYGVRRSFNRLVTSEAGQSRTMSLVESVAEIFRDAQWQRCIVHFYRNVFSRVALHQLTR